VMRGLAKTKRIAAVTMSVAIGTGEQDHWATPAFQVLKTLLEV
jgi:hypothetical protein